jgi:hypothetical protein
MGMWQPADEPAGSIEHAQPPAPVADEKGTAWDEGACSCAATRLSPRIESGRERGSNRERGGRGARARPPPL